MRPNQRMVASDGYEVMLFPLEYMVISNPEGATSHAGTLQIDFLGWDSNGRRLNCPCYAPCTCRCVASTDSSTNNRVFESLNKVHLADGTLGYVTFECAHALFPPVGVGQILNQGDLMYYTGTAGYVTGDHLHFQCARGTYAGWEQVPPDNNWQLRNEMHIYDACYVNDTILIDDKGYNWRDYTGPIPTISKKKDKFPWVLYSRKFRRKKR